jgi:hypothetical protein
VFFQCDWFDPVNDTRVDDFGMVEMKHESCYLGNNLLFAHHNYLSYPQENMKIYGWYIKLILKCTLIKMMNMWIGTRMMMSLISIKKKLKDTKVSWYLMGRDLLNKSQVT